MITRPAFGMKLIKEKQGRPVMKHATEETKDQV